MVENVSDVEPLNRVHPPSSSSSKGLVRVAHGTFRRPIDADGGAETIDEKSNTPSTGNGECSRPGKSESLSSVGSFPPMRVPHGVYMRPIDVPNYRNIMKKKNKTSIVTLENTDLDDTETRVEPLDEELEILFQDIETYSEVVSGGGTLKKPAEIVQVLGGTRRVVGGVFRKPADAETIAANSDSKSSVCGGSGCSESETGNVESQSCEAPKLSADDVSNRTNLGCEQEASPAKNCKNGTEYHSLEMPNNRRSCDFDYKARDGRAAGQSLKRPSEGTVSYHSSKVYVHGDRRTEWDASRDRNNEIGVQPQSKQTREELSTKSSDSELQIIDHRSPERNDHCEKMLDHELHGRQDKLCGIGIKCQQCGMFKTSPLVERSLRSSEAGPGKGAGEVRRAVDDHVSDRNDKSSVYGGKRSEESESNQANLTEPTVESQPRDVSKVSTELETGRCSSGVGDEMKRPVASACDLDFLSREVRIVSTMIHINNSSVGIDIQARNLGNTTGGLVRTVDGSDGSKSLVLCKNKMNGATKTNDAKTCEIVVDLGSSEEPKISSHHVEKRSRSSDSEFQVKKQRSDDGRAHIRQVETAMGFARNRGNSVGPKASILKPSGSRALVPQTGKPSNLAKLSWWDRVKHRRCRKTQVTFATRRNKEETLSPVGERKIHTSHSSTDDNSTENSGAELAGREKLLPLSKVICNQLIIRDNETEHQICHYGQSSCSSSESLPLWELDKWTSRSQDCNESVSRNRVTETLLRFRALCRELSGEGVRRVDCQAANLIKRNPDLVIPGKHIGHVPGVEVGDEFCYRLELSIVGLHKPPRAGIDFLRHGTYEICTSIVACGYGGYTNGTNDTDYLIFSGHGGNGASAQKEPADQKLLRGNLALKNSISIKNPVRVIRGNKEVGEGGKVMLTYIYDGLYQVESFWQEKAAYGKMVFKFKLGRIPGQPKLSRTQWAKLGRY